MVLYPVVRVVVSVVAVRDVVGVVDGVVVNVLVGIVAVLWRCCGCSGTLAFPQTIPTVRILFDRHTPRHPSSPAPCSAAASANCCGAVCSPPRRSHVRTKCYFATIHREGTLILADVVEKAGQRA